MCSDCKSHTFASTAEYIGLHTNLQVCEFSVVTDVIGREVDDISMGHNSRKHQNTHTQVILLLT